MARTVRNRTEECVRAQAITRLSHATAFLDAARLYADEPDSPLPYEQVAASTAILAGIAASDALCCALAGRRSRSQDHRTAQELLAQLRHPDAARLVKALSRLLDLKDTAHYGTLTVTEKEAQQAIKAATALVNTARNILSR